METSFLLAGKITELTLIVLMGVALVKAGLLKSENSYTLSVIALLFDQSRPSLIHAFQMDNAPQIIEGLKLSVMLAVFFHVVLIVLGKGCLNTCSNSMRSNTRRQCTAIRAT